MSPNCVQYIVDGVVQFDQFKIVYVAPMKALAAEMVENFGGRYALLSRFLFYRSS